MAKTVRYNGSTAIHQDTTTYRIYNGPERTLFAEFWGPDLQKTYPLFKTKPWPNDATQPSIQPQDAALALHAHYVSGHDDATIIADLLSKGYVVHDEALLPAVGAAIREFEATAQALITP